MGDIEISRGSLGRLGQAVDGELRTLIAETMYAHRVIIILTENLAIGRLLPDISRSTSLWDSSSEAYLSPTRSSTILFCLVR